MLALEAGGFDKAIFVSVDIDLNETEDQLRRFADRHGFTWRYAKAPPELVRELGQLFGQAVLNPPNEPVILVTPDNEAVLLRFGHKSADELREQIEAVAP